MVPKELAEQMSEEVRSLKEAQDKFLETYKRICLHFGGPTWRKKIEVRFHQVRSEVIPIMEKEGMDPNAVQALCSWAERLMLAE